MTYDIGFYYRKNFIDSAPEFTRIYGTSWTIKHFAYRDVSLWYARGYVQNAKNQKYRTWVTNPLVVDNIEDVPNIESIFGGQNGWWWLGDGVEATYNSKQLRVYRFLDGIEGSDTPPLAFSEQEPKEVFYRHRAVPAIGQSTRNAIHYYLRNPSTNPTREYVFINPVFLEYRPIGGYSEYEFTIYDNDTVIYSNIETQIPILDIKQGCPANTCPVDCGDHICCYGSDGIAVTSYSK